MKLFFTIWMALLSLSYSNHLLSQSNHQPYLVQQGKRFDLNDTMNRIQLKRDRFELHVFCLPYHESTNELNCVQVAIPLDSTAMLWTRANTP